MCSEFPPRMENSISIFILNFSEVLTELLSLRRNVSPILWLPPNNKISFLGPNLFQPLHFVAQFIKYHHNIYANLQPQTIWWKSTFFLSKCGRFAFKPSLSESNKLAQNSLLLLFCLWWLCIWILSRASQKTVAMTCIPDLVHFLSSKINTIPCYFSMFWGVVWLTERPERSVCLLMINSI